MFYGWITVGKSESDVNGKEEMSITILKSAPECRQGPRLSFVKRGTAPQCPSKTPCCYGSSIEKPEDEEILTSLDAFSPPFAKLTDAASLSPNLDERKSFHFSPPGLLPSTFKLGDSTSIFVNGF